MSSDRTTLAVLLAVLVVGSGFAMSGAATSHTAGNEPTEEPQQGLVITALSAPDSAAPNSTVDVSVTVENPGVTETTERVEFRVAGTVADSEWVTLEPGEETTLSLTADTTGIPPGEYVHSVFTATDGAFATLNVSESFTVDSLDAPANATSGETIPVDAQVSNPNDANVTQHVNYRFAGGLLYEEELTLAADETANVSFNVTLNGVAEGTYIHGLFTRDSGQQTTLAVTANNTTMAPATVTFSDQDSDGKMVTVDSTTLPEGGFVTIHDSSLLEGNVVGSVIGVSGPLDPGTHENVSVPLYTAPGGPDEMELDEDETLVAMPHLDTNGNDIYDFVTSVGAVDGPYLDNGSAVTDTANVSVNVTGPNGSAPPADNETVPPGNNTTTPPGEEPPAGEPPGEEPPTGETPTEGTPNGTTTAEEPATTPTETTTAANVAALQTLAPGPF